MTRDATGFMWMSWTALRAEHHVSFCAIFRQRNRRLGLIPCRRATAETFPPGCKASPMNASFSASLQRRRVSAITEYWWGKLSPDIGTDIAPVVTTVIDKTSILAPPQGCFHRRLTLQEPSKLENFGWHSGSAARSWLD